MDKKNARLTLAHLDAQPARTAREARRNRQLADECRRVLARRKKRRQWTAAQIEAMPF